MSADREELRRQLKTLEEEKKKLAFERDQALEDLHAVESAFTDLHKRYERAKVTMINLKKNEEMLLARDQIHTKKLQDKEKHIAAIKEECQSTLVRMYTDYEKKCENGDGETAKLRALLRKSEMKISTLESDLEQKTKENAQLHNLCDDLIHNRNTE